MSVASLVGVLREKVALWLAPWLRNRGLRFGDSNPPVLTAEELWALGHPNPKLGAGLSKIGFETRPGHTWRPIRKPGAETPKAESPTKSADS